MLLLQSLVGVLRSKLLLKEVILKWSSELKTREHEANLDITVK